MLQRCHYFPVCGTWQCLIEWHKKEKTLMLTPDLLFSFKTWSSENQHRVTCNMWLPHSLRWTSICLTRPSRMRSRPIRILSHEHVPPEISIRSGSPPRNSGGDLAGWVAGFQSKQTACGPEIDLHILSNPLCVLPLCL